MADKQNPANNGLTPATEGLKNRYSQINQAVEGRQTQPHVFDRLVAAHNKGDTVKASNIAAAIREVQVASGTPGAKPLTSAEKIRARRTK